MGKTLFAMNIVRHVVAKGTPVLVFSLSLSKEDWTQCFLCSSAKVDLHKTRTGYLNKEEWARLNKAVKKSSTLPLLVVDEARRLKDIKKTMEEAVKEHHIELVLIDGMSDLQGNALRSIKDRAKRYDQQLKAVQGLAAHWNIPIVVTQTLSRRMERNPHVFIPRHEFGKQEGHLSKNTDRILHLYREEFYRPTKNNRGRMQIRIPSMKFGECNRSVSVNFERDFGLVRSI